MHSLLSVVREARIVVEQKENSNHREAGILPQWNGNEIATTKNLGY